MGLGVVVETEAGVELERVDDPTNILHRLLPNMSDPDFRLIGFIDWYGDTVFNRLQAKTLLGEWDTVQARCATDAERELLSRIREMTLVVLNEHHLYLKFYGD